MGVRLGLPVGGWRSKLTKSRIEHVEGHSVAFLGASDSDKTLVAVILWLIDLNYGARNLTDLIDLLATFSDDSSNHVIRNVDLLGQSTAGQSSTGRGLSVRTSMRCGANVPCMGSVWWHMGPDSAISAGGMTTVVHRHRGIRLSLRVTTILRSGIWLMGLHVMMGTRIRAVAAVVIPVAVVAVRRLR